MKVPLEPLALMVRAALLAAALAIAAALGTARAQSLRPNILFIIADDLGLDASPCYPGDRPKPPMPNLERLCSRGVVYDNAWTTPLCSPTRATLITGRYGFNNGIGFVINAESSPDMALSEKEITLHRLLGEARAPYAVGHFGKWHLAHQKIAESHPLKMGVTHFDGHLPSTPVPGYSHWMRTTNGKTAVSTEYMTTAFTDAAIAWIGKQRQPWLAWLAYTAPHDPFHLPPAHLHSKRSLDPSTSAIQADPQPYFDAMLEALDTEIGRLLESLAPETRANTLVIFLGDNGTDPRVYRGNAPRTQLWRDSRSKPSLYQGGIAVPLIVAGAGVKRRGEREGALVDASDLFPTIAEIAGARVAHRIDGVSFAKTFSKAGAGARKFAYSELFGEPWIRTPKGVRVQLRSLLGWTVRDERYKLIQWEDGRAALFDLAVDPDENSNLLSSALEPALESRLKALREANDALKRR